VQKVGGSIPVRIKSKLPPVAFVVGVHHLMDRTGLVDPAQAKKDWVGYHVYLRHGTCLLAL